MAKPNKPTLNNTPIIYIILFFYFKRPYKTTIGIANNIEEIIE